ncbi:MAG TPA: helix-turn-helix domain-containing protein [Acidimicrobiales bacterium]|nr:helix-turn-helix domain-containing protein [Acidimicrobiales bacterium]
MAGYPHLSEVVPQLATPEEIAPLLGLSPLGVVRQCRKGRLPALKVGGRWYVHVTKLAAQLDRQAEQAKIA